MPDQMNDAFAADLAHLIASVDREEFRDMVLKLLGHAGKVGDFSVFTITDAPEGTPSFVFGAGEMGDYQIRRNAADLGRSGSYAAYVQGLVDAARRRGPEIIRERPDPVADAELWRIFERSGVIEKLYSVHIDGAVAHYISYFRRKKDGLFADEEVNRLRSLIPVVDALILLRHKLRGGSMAEHKGFVSNLRMRSLQPYAGLPPREAEICDGIVSGLSTEAIALTLKLAQSTVKTLRQRAYAKLGIATQTELFAMLLILPR